MMTIEDVVRLRANANNFLDALPTLATHRGTWFSVSADEMQELCNAWLELETRVKCKDAEKLIALERRVEAMGLKKEP